MKARFEMTFDIVDEEPNPIKYLIEALRELERLTEIRVEKMAALPSLYQIIKENENGNNVC